MRFSTIYIKFQLTLECCDRGERAVEGGRRRVESLTARVASSPLTSSFDSASRGREGTFTGAGQRGWAYEIFHDI